MKMFNHQIPAAVLTGLILGALPAYGEEGQAAFEKKCAMCHGKDGSGETASGKALKARDLRIAEVQKQNDAALAAWIAAGSKGKMPPFKDSLTAKEITTVVAYIRTLKKH
jgi:mono/diheme cytochrome c family protein